MPVYFPKPAHLPADTPLSAAVAHDGLLYISGLPGRDPDGHIPPQFASQFENIVTLMRQLLDRTGARMGNLLETTVLLTRSSDVAEMNRLYGEAFGPAPFPARTTAIVAALPHPDLLVEIRGTARLPTGA
jgi:enamine deaminase RidA (YjgF/YER057c/UK114 family)